MALLSKIRAAGLSLLLVLSAGSLAQAASPVDKAVVKDMVRVQSVMAREKYIQYEMKGTLFSPIGVGNLSLTGNGVEETDKKNTRMEKLSGDLHGTGELTLLTGQQTASQPIDAYFFAEKGQLTQYINSGKGWAKSVRPYTLPLLPNPDSKKAEKELLEYLSSAKVTKETSREKTLEFTLDGQKLAHKLPQDPEFKKQKDAEQIQSLVAQVKDVPYTVVLDKKTWRVKRLGMDMTPVLQTTGGYILDAAAKAKKITPEQQQMFTSLLGSSTLVFAFQFDYQQGKDVTLPAAVEKAAKTAE
ncbi:hypothetical protein [uncultured Acidaminococcus sp.]|uniref:hypothetical protein n=1 Tax=uncultured Acidaminococcus sp. TaxID=352152 RepID=UPI0026DD2730|nr:hypothetical protein [uncultured Acidaminococcus sp.]